MSEFIRLQANGADAYPDASTENTYRPNGTSVESALVNLESNVTTLGGVAGEAKTLAEQNSVKIATAEQEISDINSSLETKQEKIITAGEYLTTSGSGNVATALNIDYEIINARTPKDSGAVYIMTPFFNGSNNMWYVHISLIDGTPVANTNVSVVYSYFKRN